PSALLDRFNQLWAFVAGVANGQIDWMPGQRHRRRMQQFLRTLLVVRTPARALERRWQAHL
ncbi:MAG: hypothetical protein M3439_10400, partial [Chloroflexota bacterium]|nr:hypothetical protein [Chloroflexota bacterium]